MFEYEKPIAEMITLIPQEKMMADANGDGWVDDFESGEDW